MFLGILAGLTTCALWGLTFVAPRAVAHFTTWDLTIARYGIFGIVSVSLMLHPRFRPRSLSSRRWAIGLSLGGLGYVGYFILAAYAVRAAGAAIPPLIIGLMPVILALIANGQKRTVDWARLLPSLTMIFFGVTVVNVSALHTVSAGDHAGVVVGILAAVLALFIWVIYGLLNAAVMQAPNAPDGLHWTAVQGVGAGVASVLLLPLASFGHVPWTEATWSPFVIWAVVMGTAGSWGATACWVIASRRLPLALAAQLIVAETIFGLVYGFLYEKRWPYPAEWIGGSLQIVGVISAVALFARRQRA